MNKLFVMALALAITSFNSSARMVGASYEQLFNESDLIVIAQPIKSVDTDDRTTDNPWHAEFLGINTTFTIQHVVKGKSESSTLTLLHFKVGDSLIDNGPMSVSFRAESITYRIEKIGDVAVSRSASFAGPATYMLFLKKRDDGRYEPTAGQVDPVLSVREISQPFPEPPKMVNQDINIYRFPQEYDKDTGARIPPVVKPEDREETVKPDTLQNVNRYGLPQFETLEQAVSFVTNEVAFSSYKGPVCGSEWFLITMPSGGTNNNWYVNCAFNFVFADFGKESIPALIGLLDNDSLYVRYGAYMVLQQKAGRYDYNYDCHLDDAKQRQAGVNSWCDWWEKNKNNPRLDHRPQRVYEAKDWEHGTPKYPVDTQ